MRGGFIRREIEKKGPHFSISRTFSKKRVRERRGKKTISFGTIISILMDGEVLKGKSKLICLSELLYRLIGVTLAQSRVDTKPKKMKIKLRD